MRATIRTTVINLYALRPHTFTPHMAFESIVKDEILRLKNPIHACIDAVVKQLSDSIRLCVNNVSIFYFEKSNLLGHVNSIFLSHLTILLYVQIKNFPKLRFEIESKIMSQVYSTKSQSIRNVMALIDMEWAYQNTNHEEFHLKDTDDEVIHEGVLCIENLNDIENGERMIYFLRVFFMNLLYEFWLFFKTGNSYWFELKSNSLSCKDFKNGNKEMFAMPLNGVKTRYDPNSNKYRITLYNPNGNVYLASKELTLSSDSADYIKKWAKAFTDLFNKIGIVSQNFILSIIPTPIFQCKNKSSSIRYSVSPSRKWNCQRNLKN